MGRKTDEVITVVEAAAILGIRSESVRVAMYAGRLPFFEFAGRKLLRRPDVMAYKERTQPNGEPVNGRPRKRKLSEDEGIRTVGG